MAISPIIVRYQEKPIVMAICPEFNIEITQSSTENFDEIRSIFTSKLVHAIATETSYFTEYPEEVRKELQRYLRIKQLSKKLRNIQDFIWEEPLAERSIANKYGFRV